MIKTVERLVATTDPRGRGYSIVLGGYGNGNHRRGGGGGGKSRDNRGGEQVKQGQ